MNWTQAVRKLGEFRLTNPFHYVLRLVRAGVLAGATRIDIQTSLEGTRVEFDAPVGAPEELGQLLDRLVGWGSAHELAVATAAALATRPFSLVLEVRNGRTGARWEDDRLTEVSGARLGTLFVLRRKRAANRMREFFTLYSPEAAVLSRRCAFCPIPLRVNQRLVNRPQDFGSPRLPFLVPADHLLVEARYPDSGTNVVALPVRSQASHCWGASHRLVGCALGLCHGRPSQFREGQGNSFLFVHAGVALYWEEVPMETSPVLGIVTTSGLRLDLSGDRVIKDSSYATRAQWLAAHAAWLRRYAEGRR